jgi:hypothetical protein
VLLPRLREVLEDALRVRDAGRADTLPNAALLIGRQRGDGDLGAVLHPMQ